MKDVASGLGQHADDYDPKKNGGQTQCSKFLFDFAKGVYGQPIPELNAPANGQVDRIEDAAKKPGTGWLDITPDNPKNIKEWGDQLRDAHRFANSGLLVVIGYKDPINVGGGVHGHVAIVMPGMQMVKSGNSWGQIDVPKLAQAGKGGLNMAIEMNEAFPSHAVSNDPAKGRTMHIFVYDQGGEVNHSIGGFSGI